MYKVLFAEDELLVRLGLQNSIPWREFDMELAAQAENGTDAFRLFQEIRPDLVITDIRMDGLDGHELIRRIREIDGECAIIVISCLDDFDTLKRLLPYKLSGYITKASMSMEEIFDLLREVEEYLGRIGRGHAAEEEESTVMQRLSRYLTGEEGECPLPGEENISAMLLFLLSDEDQKKINNLAIKFVCDLIRRQIPDGLLAETSPRELCLLIRDGAGCDDSGIERVNRSVEGFLGIRFIIVREKRRSGISLRELYRSLKDRAETEYGEPDRDNRLVNSAIRYMYEHHQNSLGLMEMSGVLGISPSYFSHLFKRVTGKTFVEFLNEIRLEEAMKEMKSSDRTISEIAGSHGFMNLEYFSRFFKKATGLPPSRWRKRNR